MTTDRTTAPTPHANVIDRTNAPTEVFEAARASWEAREAHPDGFRERAAQALFVARGFRRKFWAHGTSPTVEAMRADCRFLIDRVFDEVSPMTAAPVPSAPDRRAHEQQQLAEAIWGRSSDPGVMLPSDARLLHRIETVVMDLIDARVAEALRPFLELAVRLDFEAPDEDADRAVTLWETAERIRAAAPQPTDRP